MCGRIAYSIPHDVLISSYPWVSQVVNPAPRYNIAPTDPVLAVGPDRAEVVRWGIDGAGSGLFNLRSETATERPYYQRMLLQSRVLVPASHFYEWRSNGASRLPVAVFRGDGRPLNLAGVIAAWKGRPAVTVLTTIPNDDIAGLHNRMPVVLNDDDAATWVLEDMSLDQVAGFLKPCPNGWLRLAAASPLLNDVRNEGPDLLDPAALPPEFQLELIP